jgi:hypothetical protein
MNPILVKELRQSLRSRWFEIIFLWLCASLTLITAIGSAINAKNGTTVLFWIAVATTFHLLLPFRTVLSARDDRQRGNFELIRVAGLSAEKLTNQRITALLFHTLTLASLVLPFVILRYFLGGIEISSELTYLVLLTLGTPVVGSAFLWVSTTGAAGRVLLAGLFFVLLPAYESLTFAAAFTPAAGALPAFVVWTFGSVIGTLVSQAFASEGFLLHTLTSNS